MTFSATFCKYTCENRYGRMHKKMPYFNRLNHENILSGASDSVTVSQITKCSSVSNVKHIPCSFLTDTTLFKTTKHCSIFALQHISAICCCHRHRALLFLEHRLTFAGTWALRKVDQTYLECFDMWCRRRMEKIRWLDRVTNEVSQTVKEERNIVQTITRTEAK